MKPLQSKKTMKIQTLAAAIDQTDHRLVEKLNIQTDALIGNQCGREGTETFSFRGRSVVYINAQDRGVGKNRNRLLDHADGDLLILADDDLRFVDGYPEIAANAVRECADADVYVFNLIEQKPRRYINRKIRCVGWRQYARYGAARLMLRREAIERSGIRFSLEFGGGAEYGSGEDTLFLRDCLKHGLKICAVPYALAEIDQEAPSSWFHGYDHKFFFDKGALYAALYPRWKPVFAIRYLIHYYGKYAGQYRMIDALRAMREGMESYQHDHKGAN